MHSIECNEDVRFSFFFLLLLAYSMQRLPLTISFDLLTKRSLNFVFFFAFVVVVVHFCFLALSFSKSLLVAVSPVSMEYSSKNFC